MDKTIKSSHKNVLYETQCHRIWQMIDEQIKSRAVRLNGDMDESVGILKHRLLCNVSV